MSMNIAFEKPNGELVDFPFQTPTKLTRQILAEPSDIKKLRIIKEYLEEEDWIEEDILKIVAQIRRKHSYGYKLVMI
jgi:hypothetical protein